MMAGAGKHKRPIAPPEDRLTHDEAVAIVAQWDAYGKKMAGWAWQKNPRWGTLDEFRLAAQEGLWAAAIRFEPGRKLKFCTFAHWHIRRACQQLVFDNKGVSRRQNENPMFYKVSSLDTPRVFPDGTEATLADVIESRPQPDKPEFPEDFWNRVNKFLDPRLQDVIRMRFRENQTLQHVADKMGLTRERIRQLEGKALTRIAERADLSFFE